MFNSRKQAKKMMKEEKEDKVVRKMDKPSIYYNLEKEDQKGSLVPIVFTSEGILGNDQVFAEPLKMFEMMNLSTVENAEIALEPLNRSQLTRLDWNNRDIIKFNVENYIKQQSFLSFCGYLDSIIMNMPKSFKEVLDFIPLKEKVREYIFADKEIYQFINSLYNYTNTFSSLQTEEQVKSSIIYCRHISYQVSNLIMLDYCKAIDESVNDIILQLHTIPNINQVYINIAKTNNALMEILEKTPNNFQIACAQYVKEIIISNIGDLFNQVIIPGINDVIHYSGFTAFYVYSDFLDVKFPKRKYREEDPEDL